MYFSTALTVILVILDIVFYYLQEKQREDDQRNSSLLSSSDKLSVHEQDHGERKDSSSSWSQCRRFSLDEIKLATHDFDEAFVIGKGGFGKVYKGTIDSAEVAIKRSDIDSNQGEAEFWAEIEMLSKFRHSHIVSLLGYCQESSTREMILVYEYLPNGSLDDHLHKKRTNGSNPSSLTWVQRLNICIGAARGLDYLHTGTGVQFRVIHRDVKSSNILLDENWAGKISDFGLSRTGPAYQLGSTTNVYTSLIRGTFGYMDAEYFATHRLTRKSDVYAFGVVLFEVLCGRPAVDFTLDEQQHSLAGWAKHCVRAATIHEVVDPCLRGQFSTICLKEFTQIAYKCLHRSPKDRPTMAEVVVRLECVLALVSQKHGGVTIVEKVWSFFSIKIPAVHTKHYKTRQKLSNDSKSKRDLLDQAASALEEGRSEVKNNNVINIVHPTKEAAMLKTQTASSHNLKIFTFEELRSATRNFRPSALLGVGDGESVYKGWVDSSSYAPSIPGVGIAVAIKISNTDRVQSLKQWQAEVNRGKFSHPNLVKLLGYCSQDTILSLVYEYIPKRNLVNHLVLISLLQWDTTMKVATGAAQGLAFLHATENAPVNRTFNSSNILLNENYEAKLYFGSASLRREHGGAMPLFMTDAVTNSYTPPEYMATGQWYAKSDVYSFGVMMLYMIAGSRFLGNYPCSSSQSLMEWARPILTDNTKLQRVMDPYLEQSRPPKGARIVAELILSCLEIDPENRPSMKQVVASLESVNAIENQLKFFDTK